MTAVLPWGDGPPKRADKLILVGFAAALAYGLVTLLVAPSQVASHPLLLQVTTGSSLAQVTVGAKSRLGEIPLPLALVAGVPATMAFDWVYWWAGRRWGDRSLHLLLGRSPKQAHARAARLERLAARFGPVAVVLAYYLPLPSPLVYAAAGLAGMRLRTFLLLDALGTLLWTGLLVLLGYGLGQRAIDVVDEIEHYSLVITGAIVVVLVVVSVLRRSRRAPRRPRG